jgi:hypothetical protein
MLPTGIHLLALYAVPVVAAGLAYAASRFLGLSHREACLICYAAFGYFHMLGRGFYAVVFREERLGVRIPPKARVEFLTGMALFAGSTVVLLFVTCFVGLVLAWRLGAKILAALVVVLVCHLILPWVFVLPFDYHRRGRRLLTYQEAATASERMLPAGDPGVFWGGIRHPTHELSQSHYLAAGVTRSGKTITIRLCMQSIIPLVGMRPERKPAALRDTRFRVAAYDPKSELLPLLHSMANCRVVLIHPFDARGYAWAIRDDIVTDFTIALEIASCLIPRQEGENNPFFTEGARALLAGLMISLALSGGEWNLLDVTIATRSRKTMRAVLERHPQTRHLVEQYFEPEETFRNILSTIANQMTLFEPVANLWAAAEREGKVVSIKEWLEGDFILVLGNDDSRRVVIDALNQALFGRIASLLLRPDKPAGERNVVILDELREAGHLPGLRRLLNKGLGEGSTVIAGFTDISGLEAADAYGEKEAKEMLGMFANKAILRLESESTAEWAARTFGEFERFEYPVSEADQGKTNTREELVKRESILPSQFLDILPTGPGNGLTGYYLAPAIGAYRATLPWSFVMGRLIPAASPQQCPKFVKRDIPPFVEGWSAEDLERLRMKPYLVPDGDKAPAAEGGASTVNPVSEQAAPAEKRDKRPRLRVKYTK